MATTNKTTSKNTKKNQQCPNHKATCTYAREQLRDTFDAAVLVKSKPGNGHKIVNKTFQITQVWWAPWCDESRKENTEKCQRKKELSTETNIIFALLLPVLFEAHIHWLHQQKQRKIFSICIHRSIFFVDKMGKLGWYVLFSYDWLVTETSRSHLFPAMKFTKQIIRKHVHQEQRKMAFLTKISMEGTTASMQSK